MDNRDNLIESSKMMIMQVIQKEPLILNMGKNELCELKFLKKFIIIFKL